MTTRTFLDDMLEGGVKGIFYTDRDTNYVYRADSVYSSLGGPPCLYGRVFFQNGESVNRGELNVKGVDKCFRDFQASDEILDRIYKKNPDVAPGWYKQKQASGEMIERTLPVVVSILQNPQKI